MDHTTANAAFIRVSFACAVLCAALCGCGDERMGAELQDAAPERDAAPKQDASLELDATVEQDAAELESPDAEAASVATFRRAFEAGDYDALPDLIAELASASEAAPDDSSIALTLALANLWGVAEAGRNPQLAPSALGGFAFAAQAGFMRAQQLAPSDTRIDGWLGSVRIGIGTNLASPALVESGYETLALAVEKDLEFNGFVQAFQLAKKPIDDPAFEGAASVFFEVVSACGLEVTREQPSLAEVDQPLVQGASTVCGNGSKMPHNLEGFWLYGGDILLKSGELTIARALYENALREGRARAWPYAQVAEQRMADAPDWLARLRDADADNDPPLAWQSAQQCVLCHAR